MKDQGMHNINTTQREFFQQQNVWNILNFVFEKSKLLLLPTIVSFRKLLSSFRFFSKMLPDTGLLQWFSFKILRGKLGSRRLEFTPLRMLEHLTAVKVSPGTWMIRDTVTLIPIYYKTGPYWKGTFWLVPWIARILQYGPLRWTAHHLVSPPICCFEICFFFY